MITVEVNATPEFRAMMQHTSKTANMLIHDCKERALKAGVNRCRYIGKDLRFQDRIAIVRRDEKGILCAQFEFKTPGVADETDLVCFGWHAVFELDWEIKIEVNL